MKKLYFIGLNLVAISVLSQPLTLNDPVLLPKARNVAIESLKQTSGSGSTGLGPFCDAAGDKSFSDNFTASSSYSLTQVKLKFGRFNSSVTGQLRCHIYACSGAVATGTPTGSTLGQSSNTIDVSTLTSTGYPNGQTQVTFLMPNIALTSGTVYCHVIIAESFSGVAMSFWGINTAAVSTISVSPSPPTTWTATYADWVMAYENWGL